MESWVNDIDFERLSPLRRGVKLAIINPIANYAPAGMVKGLLRFGKSELASANWNDPGGWRSMVISYEGKPRQLADKVLVGGGTIPMALRNRKRLGARLLARLIDETDHEPARVLCLGAGPGQIIIDAMRQAKHKVLATLVDLSGDAFDYGRELARKAGLQDNVRFVQGDVRDNLEHVLDDPPDVIKMLGICEYLTDEQITDIVSSVSEVAPPGAAIVFNSLCKRHGTDRFFRRVFGLHMNHRSPAHVQCLVAAGGFDHFVSIPEPLGVYHVIVGRRSPAGAADASKGS